MHGRFLLASAQGGWRFRRGTGNSAGLPSADQTILRPQARQFLCFFYHTTEQKKNQCQSKVEIRLSARKKNDFSTFWIALFDSHFSGWYNTLSATDTLYPWPGRQALWKTGVFHKCVYYRLLCKSLPSGGLKSFAFVQMDWNGNSGGSKNCAEKCAVLIKKFKIWT